jgi:hypothetical protein
MQNIMYIVRIKTYHTNEIHLKKLFQINFFVTYSIFEKLFKGVIVTKLRFWNPLKILFLLIPFKS